jgi:HEAT repeat protein
MRTAGIVLLDPARNEADRINTITVLIRNGDRSSIPLLTNTLLKDPFPSVRRIVAEGLGGYQAPEAVFALREAALTGPIDSVRWASGVSLVQIDPSQGDIIDILLSDRDTLAAASFALQNESELIRFPQQFHQRTIDALINAVPQELTYNTVERSSMIRALALLGADDAISTISSILTNLEDDPFVRGSAAFSLGLLGDKASVPDMIASLNTNEDALQVGAMGALQKLVDPQSIDPLISVLTTEDTAEVRASAASALGAFGEIVIPSLVDALNTDENIGVREFALNALASIGGSEVTDAVLGFIDSGFLATCDPQECSNLALAVLNALADLGESDLAVELLVQTLDFAVDFLPFAFAFTEDLLISTAVNIAQDAPQVLDLLLNHENAFVVAIGLGALPVVQGADSRATLLPFTDPDANRLLRRMAMEGLAQFPQTEDLELFTSELFNRDRRTRGAGFNALAQIGDETSVAPLLEALTSDNLSIQLQAVEASIQFGDRVLNMLMLDS